MGRLTRTQSERCRRLALADGFRFLGSSGINRLDALAHAVGRGSAGPYDCQISNIILLKNPLRFFSFFRVGPLADEPEFVTSINFPHHHFTGWISMAAARGSGRFT